MKTFKTILLMMLFASVTLSSCSDDDDLDLTGDVIITVEGEYYAGGTYEIYTEEAALVERTNYSAKFYPRPVKSGHLFNETIVEGLNHGTYYIRCLNKESYNESDRTFQVTGGKTTRLSASSLGIKVVE
ncbi:hypothetical protein [Marinifilum flexuosum]|uniref:hypothetical protein n=1 Tax=Marinifilum flexuosum TaxID=1117708 RepID=UPI0024935176|nr:hypothetical protein [Marinifilum flexuosum]